VNSAIEFTIKLSPNRVVVIELSPIHPSYFRYGHRELSKLLGVLTQLLGDLLSLAPRISFTSASYTLSFPGHSAFAGQPCLLIWRVCTRLSSVLLDSVVTCPNGSKPYRRRDMKIACAIGFNLFSDR
jgi:hypothetical protein